MPTIESSKFQQTSFLNPISSKLEKKANPLIEAIQKKDFSQIENLILQNASPFDQDTSKFNAIDYTVFLNQESILPSFFGQEKETLYIPAKASQTSYSEIKKILAQAKLLSAQSNLVTQNIYAGNVSNICHFFETSDYLFDYNPVKGLTAMHFAACGKSTAMVDLLYEKGFIIDAKDLQGRTPLHYAALNKNKDLFTKLLDLGSNPLEEDHLKVTPLDLLVIESKEKDPLKVSIHERINLFAIALLTTYYTCHSFSLIPNSISDTAHLTAFYFAQIAQMSLLLKGSPFSSKKIILGSAAVLACSQFTITRLALNALILSKLCLSSFSSIKHALPQFWLRPKEVVKKISSSILQPSLFGIFLTHKYSYDTLTYFFEDISKIPGESFFQTELGEQTLEEYQDLYLFCSAKFESLRSFLGI